jgi:hypothetical protein
MNTANPKHISDSTTQNGQDHVGTRVLLVLKTNTRRILLENQTTPIKPFHKYHQAHITIWRAMDLGATLGRKLNKAEANCPHKSGDSTTNLWRLHNLRSFLLSFGNSTTSEESITKFRRLHNFRRIRNKVPKTPQLLMTQQLIFRVPESAFMRKREKSKLDQTTSKNHEI